MNLTLLDQDFVWHPFTPFTERTKVLPICKAEGIYLHTEDGRKIIDAISSWWVNLHGHSHPHIAEAIGKQAHELAHIIFAGFTHEPATLLAQKLLEHLPSNQSKIFYSDNGSTACEVALKMSIQFWHNQNIPKNKIIALKGAYHGDTFGAMALGERGVFSIPFDPYLFEVEFIDLPHSDADYLVNFEKTVSKGNVAAFIYEPLVQGASGMRMYAAENLEKILQIAKNQEVICIADEVMTGFGRTGKWFASDYCKTKPDIICLSKGLTGGTMALGVTSCTERIFEAYKSTDLMKTFFHGHSFTANPLACRAALASMELLEKPDCQANIQRISQEQSEFATKIASHPKVRNTRQIGTIVAIEIETDQETSYINEARSSLYEYFLSKNVLLRPLGNVIYILPPYVISSEELTGVQNIIFEYLESL